MGATGIEPAFNPIKSRMQSQRLLHSRVGLTPLVLASLVALFAGAPWLSYLCAVSFTLCLITTVLSVLLAALSWLCHAISPPIAWHTSYSEHSVPFVKMASAEQDSPRTPSGGHDGTRTRDLSLDRGACKPLHHATRDYIVPCTTRLVNCLVRGGQIHRATWS